MSTYIMLGGAKIRQNVIANGVAVPVGCDDDAYDLWRDCEHAIAYDALCVVARDAEAAEILRDEIASAGGHPGEPVPVYHVDGPRGYVVHTLYRD